MDALRQLGRATVFVLSGMVAAHAEEQIPPKMQKCLTDYPSVTMTGLLQDAKLSIDRPIIIVDEDVWRATPFKDKALLGDFLHCMYAPDDPNQSPNVAWYEAEFRSNMTNKVLGKLRYGKLEESE